MIPIDIQVNRSKFMPLLICCLFNCFTNILFKPCFTQFESRKQKQRARRAREAKKQARVNRHWRRVRPLMARRARLPSEEKKITPAPTPQKKKEEFVVGEFLYRSPCMSFVSIVNLFFNIRNVFVVHKLQEYKKWYRWNLCLVHRCLIRFLIMHVVTIILLFCSTCRCFVDFCCCNWCF